MHQGHIGVVLRRAGKHVSVVGSSSTKASSITCDLCMPSGLIEINTLINKKLF
jgi:hypothetical protein